MKSSADNVAPAETSSEAEDNSTGLPWPHTWRGVYLLVLGSFILWVGLLIALTRYFS
jgi:hypothetical protein